jgi:hypothetical protein
MNSRRTNTAHGARRAATHSSQASARAGTIWLRAFAISAIVLIAGLAGPDRVAAYNICDDDDSCTHEVMTEKGLDFYYEHATDSGNPHPFAQEIKDNWPAIKQGVGDPDRFDPLYGNSGIGGALITITHFWSPDDSLDEPMHFEEIGEDDYPNAFQAASALWSRALGEYAAGNKEGAYRFLGMVAHFLGDRLVGLGCLRRMDECGGGLSECRQRDCR